MMMLYTQNGFNGRRRRVMRVTSKIVNPSYVNNGKSSISFYVNGQDNIMYTIDLDDDDIKKIVEAREEYNRYFEEVSRDSSGIDLTDQLKNTPLDRKV